MKYLKALRRLYANACGTALIEFALALPLLVLLLFGGVEIARYVWLHQKLDHAVASIGDLIARPLTMDNGQLNAIMNSSESFFDPFNFNANGAIIFTLIRADSEGNRVEVTGRRRVGGNAGSSRVGGGCGASANVPGSDYTPLPNDHVIVVEGYYRYQPLLFASVIGNRDLYFRQVYRARNGRITFDPPLC